jgi:hypothetical protein
MKRILFLIAVAISTTAFAQPASTDINWSPTAKFNQMTHDFGSIAEGPKVFTEFTFTNTGKEPIRVQNAQAGCGCTTPEWVSTPVAPGKTGTIKVGYNSEGRPGSFNKDVTVTFVAGMNNEKTGTSKLIITGNVEGKNGALPTVRPTGK